MFLTELHRRKQQGNRNARHEVIERKQRAPPHALEARPVVHTLPRIVKGDRLSGDIARGAKCERTQVPALDARANARPVHVLRQQLAQRRVIQHGLRRRQQEPAGNQRQHPMDARPKHVDRIDAKHLPGVEVAPHFLEPTHRAAPVHGLGREHARRHRTGRCTDDHLERTASARKDFCQGAKHAHLVSRTCPTARQHEPEARSLFEPALCLRYALIHLATHYREVEPGSHSARAAAAAESRHRAPQESAETSGLL